MTTAVNNRITFWGILHGLAGLGMILCAIVLACTGFAPMVTGQRLWGYALMLHATVAPVFVTCLAYVALSGAQGRTWQGGSSWWAGLGTVCFWLMLLVSLPLILSMVLSMFPWFGTHGQEVLFDVHRISAMVWIGSAGVGCVTRSLGRALNRGR